MACGQGAALLMTKEKVHVPMALNSTVKALEYFKESAGTCANKFDFSSGFDSKATAEAVYAAISGTSKTGALKNGVAWTGGTNGHYYMRPSTLENNANAGIVEYVRYDGGSGLTHKFGYWLWSNLESSCGQAGVYCILLERWTQASDDLCYGAAATASGDPHLVNILGQKFDLLQRGTHVLIQIPRGAAPEDTLLRVEANVTEGESCDYAFIKGFT